MGWGELNPCLYDCWKCCKSPNYAKTNVNPCIPKLIAFPGEAELVSEWTGLPGRAKCVHRFERSDGLDTALYKNSLFTWAGISFQCTVAHGSEQCALMLATLCLLSPIIHHYFSGEKLLLSILGLLLTYDSLNWKGPTGAAEWSLET